MAEKELIYCKHCLKETEHTRITPAMAVCSVFGCGQENKKGRKPKETAQMKYKKLDERETAELVGIWTALTQEEKTPVKILELASRYEVSKSTIIRKVTPGAAAAKSAPGKKKKPQAKTAKQKPAGGVFQQAVGRIVDERMIFVGTKIDELQEEISALRDSLPELIEAALKKIINA